MDEKSEQSQERKAIEYSLLYFNPFFNGYSSLRCGSEMDFYSPEMADFREICHLKSLHYLHILYFWFTGSNGSQGSEHQRKMSLYVMLYSERCDMIANILMQEFQLF